MDIFNCIWYDDLESLKEYVSNGKDVNKKTELGHTPLFYAIKNRSQEIIEFLVNNGANVNSKDHWGETPLDLAIDCENKVIIEFLVSKGAKKGKEL